MKTDLRLEVGTYHNLFGDRDWLGVEVSLRHEDMISDEEEASALFGHLFGENGYAEPTTGIWSMTTHHKGGVLQMVRLAVHGGEAGAIGSALSRLCDPKDAVVRFEGQDFTCQYGYAPSKGPSGLCALFEFTPIWNVEEQRKAA